MSEHIEALANEVAGDMVKEEGVDNAKAFDPMTIMVIIQVISFIINLFKKKNLSTAELIRHAQKANLLQRAIIKSKLKRYMRENSNHYDTYEDQKDNVLKVSLRKIGMTEPAKLEAVMSEVPSIQASYLD